MTDRELLEAAAKAAGMEVWDWLPGLCFQVKNYHADKRWHPIHDDGDALRLLVTMGLRLKVTRGDRAEVDEGEDSSSLAAGTT